MIPIPFYESKLSKTFKKIEIFKRKYDLIGYECITWLIGNNILIHLNENGEQKIKNIEKGKTIDEIINEI